MIFLSFIGKFFASNRVNLFHTDSLEIEAMQWPMLQKGFSQTSQGAKLTANNLFLAANSCKQIVYLFTFEGFQKVFQLDYEIHT